MWWTVAMVGGCLSEPPPPPPAPDPLPAVGPDHDAIGGVMVGVPLDRTGFVCEAGRCEQPADVGGVSGTLIVRMCGDLVHTISFKGSFINPDPAAARVGRPGMTAMGPWTNRIVGGLKDVGFAVEAADEAGLQTFRETIEFGQQREVGGRKLERPSLYYVTHPDGRVRGMSVVEHPAPADVAALDPRASVYEIIVYTSTMGPCTVGL